MWRKKEIRGSRIMESLIVFPICSDE